MLRVVNPCLTLTKPGPQCLLCLYYAKVDVILMFNQMFRVRVSGLEVVFLPLNWGSNDRMSLHFIVINDAQLYLKKSWLENVFFFINDDKSVIFTKKMCSYWQINLFVLPKGLHNIAAKQQSKQNKGYSLFTPESQQSLKLSWYWHHKVMDSSFWTLNATYMNDSMHSLR